MKNTMKKIIAFLAAVLMIVPLLALTSCASYKTLDQIKKSGKLVLYTEAGFAPYEFMYNNELVGVDIEIMKEVAKEIGVDLEIIDVAFDTIFGSIQSGKGEVGAAGITINADRKENFDFSHPYSKTEQYVIVLSKNEIPTVEDLKGKQIGVQLGTTSDSLIQDLIKDKTLEGSTSTGYTTPALAAAALGKIDAVVTDKLTAEIIVNASSGGFKCAKLLKADGTEAAEVEEYGIMVAKGNQELLDVINTVVDRLLADGTIDKWTAEFNEKAAPEDTQ